MRQQAEFVHDPAAESAEPVEAPIRPLRAVAERRTEEPPSRP
jgi:hypothetical protein